jgi:hypothetical protein
MIVDSIITCRARATSYGIASQRKALWSAARRSWLWRRLQRLNHVIENPTFDAQIIESLSDGGDFVVDLVEIGVARRFLFCQLALVEQQRELVFKLFSLQDVCAMLQA